MNGLYVIAGASGAIGRAICHNVRNRGGTPLLVGRSSEKLNELNDELGGKFPMLPDIDFRDPEEAGKRLTSELKGEKLKGLACKLFSSRQEL